MLDFLKVLLATLALLVAAAEVGFVVGRRKQASSDQEGRSQISMVEGALLGLLALLLGFTFSMAVARFDSRQDLVLREANALGTAGLRADLLPLPVQEALRPKLRAYGDARVEYSTAGGDNAAVEAAMKKSSALQKEIWAGAVAEAAQHPTPITALYVASLNELFDLADARAAARFISVPRSVWFVLFLVASLAAGSLGFGAGLIGRRLTLQVNLIPLLLAIILTLLVDLDHPRQGMIQVSSESLIRARADLK